MKIGDVLDNIDSFTDEMLVKYLKKHNDEVYSLGELASKVECDTDKLRIQLRRLEKKGVINSFRITDARNLYGTTVAIKSLEDAINENSKSL